MKFGPRKDGKIHYVITHNIIQKNDLSVYCWQCAHASFEKKCFPTFFQIIGHHFKRSVNTLIVHAWSGVHCVLSHIPTQLQ